MFDVKIKTVSREQFAEFVLNNLHEGQTLEFALDANSRVTGEYTNWWVAFWISRPEYGIQTLYIDYAGGGYPAVFAFDGDVPDFQERLSNYFLFHDSYTEAEGINIDLNSIKEDK